MIDAIRLRNFRGFEETTLPLSPLTVLLGPNSAGKSSFGHAVAAMAHAQRTQFGSVQATLTPPDTDEAWDAWPVHLGDFKDVRTVGRAGRVFVDFLTPEGWVEQGFGDVGGVSDLRLSYLPDRPSQSFRCDCAGFRCRSSRPAEQFGRRACGALRIHWPR
jgi:hypothetical protein